MSRPVPNEFPSVDPGSIRLALCGESPGADEAAMGRPFCGKAGWALNTFLASAGISRSQVFVGNVSQIKPGSSLNDFNLLEWNEGPIQEGIAALREDLARFCPNIVVALGNAALHLLRHGNIAPPKSAKLRLFQWRSHVGTWRGSLFLAAASFDRGDAATLRMSEGRCPPLAVETLSGHSRTSSAPLSPVAQRDDTPGGGSFSMASLRPLSLSGDSEPSLVAAHSLAPSGVAVLPPLADSMAKEDALALVQMDRGNEAGGRSAGVQVSNLAAVSAFREGDVIAGSTGGHALPAVALPPFKCLATYHPAATFREPSFAFPLVSDLKRAVVEARSPLLELPPRRIVWGLAIEELEARCQAIRAARQPVGFDIEGGLGGLQCASFATSPHDAFVIDLMGERFDRPRTMAALASVLEDPAVPKVLWNAAYERAILHAVASITLRGYEDGMLAWWERFSELPKGLDFVASILTREPYWAEGIGWDRRTGAPKVTGAPFLTYNALDSLVCLEIWQHPLIRAVAESRTPVAFTL